MSQTIARTWPEELLAEGEARGELRNSRQLLQELLEKRFGTLPEELMTKIEQTQDVERLHRGIHQVLDIQELTELEM